MSYISLIVPAFHLNTGNINEIKNYCSSHFDVSEDLIKVIELTGPTLKNSYGIIFEKSILNLNKIQELIYEKNCLKSFNEKIYESFRLLDQKINDLKQCINDFNKNKKEEKYINDENKNKQLIVLIKIIKHLILIFSMLTQKKLLKKFKLILIIYFEI